MEAAQTYQVKLEVFEGPLDLLLFLIRKKKLDIHDIPMAVITREYLEYLEHMEQINLEREAEFLLIAALLIYIKSQMLLPRESVLENEGDPRQDLVDRLLDHQKIKAACSILRDKEKDQMQTWQRTTLPPLSPSDDLEFIEVSLFDLAEVFFTIMKRREREDVKLIQGKDLSAKEKIDEIVQHLKSHKYLDFLEYFERQTTLEEALFSFLCLLELIKSRVIFAAQDSLFSPIKVWLRKKELHK
jgi:segregation and condensation protein A